MIVTMTDCMHWLKSYAAVYTSIGILISHRSHHTVQ